MNTLTSYRSALNAKLAELAVVDRQVSDERKALRSNRREQQYIREALALAQAVAKRIQEEAHRRVSDIVTRSLAAIFDEPYEFRILFEEKRGRTEARLVFYREGVEFDPMDAAGGGVVDVAAFALRLSCILLSQPPLQRIMVLDEPFRFVSAEYRPRVAALLMSLAKELGCQFIIVTHQEEMRIGKVVEL